MDDTQEPLEVPTKLPGYETTLTTIRQRGGFSEEEWSTKETITAIELVIEDLNCMQPLEKFKGIQSVYLMSCCITKISGVGALPKLEYLWLNENLITDFDGLQGCKSLKKLNLHNNKISKMMGFSGLESLEDLILSQNNISVLENLDKLPALKSLNMAMNQVEGVACSLDTSPGLRELNIAGNKICDIGEVLVLKKLTSLKVISFFDPNYGENPICKIYNYQTFMLYHFSHLEKFDNLVVNEEAKRCAEIEFKKKKIYYNMKIRALRRLFVTLQKVLKSAKNARKEVINQGIRLMKEFASIRAVGQQENSRKARSILLTKVEEEVYLDDIYDRTIQFFQKELDRHIYFILKELESTGNFKLEEGGRGDRWYQSCINLVRSRFYPEDLKAYGIADLNVYRVLRIHNRFLRNRFEERIEVYLDQSNPNYKKSFEYLFYGRDPQCPDEFWSILEHGYSSSSECKAKEICPHMPLVNSVVAADKARLLNFLSKKKKSDRSAVFGEALQKLNDRLPPGHLLVCKVIIVRPQQDPRFPTFDINTSFTETCKQCPIDESILAAPEVAASFRESGTEGKHKVWFIHDNTLILPEYLICFDYELSQEAMPKYDSFYIGESLITSLDPELKFARPYNDKDTVDNVEQALSASVKEIKKRHENTYSDRANDSILQFNYQDIQKFGIGFLKIWVVNFMLLCSAEDVGIQSFKSKLSLLGRSKKQLTFPDGDPAEVKTLHCCQCGLKEVPDLKAFTSLIFLDLSHNKLIESPNLSGLALLNNLLLSGNQLTGLPDLSFMVELTHLDISYNRFSDINVLKNLQNNTKLESFEVRGNPFLKKFSHPTLVILKLLPKIKKLDERSLLEVKKEHAARRALTLDPNLIQNEDPSAKIESLVSLKLKEKKITRIGDLSSLKSLTRLNISWNKLISLSGISSLKQLTNLNVENNLISKLDGLEQLKKLQKLELGFNSISKIGTHFKELKELTHLSIEANRIISLDGLQHLESILELYIGENLIGDLKEVRHLSPLQKLIVIDLLGNSLCKEFDYRLYVIFQVKDIKVLDGASVTQIEFEEAREAFTGRLSEELLATKLKGQNYRLLKSMDLSRCKLRDFDSVFTNEKFPVIQEINLSKNHFTCFKSFRNLTTLKILIISENRINSFEPIVEPRYRIGLNSFPNIEMLDVSKNKFTTLEQMRFFKLSRIYVLKAGNNHIRSIQGISHLHSLRDIDLSANRIKQVDNDSFNSSMKLKYLCLDENFIKSLNNLCVMEKLNHLFVRYNKVSDYNELTGLSSLMNLKELEISSNPLSRKHGSRYNLIQRLPALIYLDGLEVSLEERQRVELSMNQDIGRYNVAVSHGYRNVGPQSPHQLPSKIRQLEAETIFSRLSH